MSRRAAAYREVGKLKDAMDDLNNALRVDKESASLCQQHVRVSHEFKKKQQEKDVDVSSYWTSWVKDEKRSYHLARVSLQREGKKATVQCRLAGGLDLIVRELMSSSSNNKILVNLVLDLTSQNDVNRTELRLRKDFVRYVDLFFHTRDTILLSTSNQTTSSTDTHSTLKIVFL